MMRLSDMAAVLPAVMATETQMNCHSVGKPSAANSMAR